MAIPRPTAYPLWTDGNSLKVTQPPSALQLQGWTPGEPPPPDYLNWLQYMTGLWIAYLDGQLNGDVSTFNLDQVMRLINGGTWSWDLTTQSLAWSSAFQLSIPSLADSQNQAAAGSVTIDDGQIAYVTANIPFNTTGNTTDGSNQITEVPEVGPIGNGYVVTMTGVPSGATVVGNPVQQEDGTYTITINENATANGVDVLANFANSGALTVQVATNDTFLPNANTVLIARRVGAVVYVGVNASQMIMHDGENRILMENGYTGIFRGTAGVNINAGQCVYISLGTGVDSGRTAGDVYLADTSSTNGAARSAWVGFVFTNVTSGNLAQVVTEGIATGFTGLTVGATYYVDPANPGGITATKPTTSGQFVAPVGVAISATTIQMNAALGAVAAQVATVEAYPNFFCASETDLANAITSAIANGGGVICMLSSFTITSAHTIPSGTRLIGRDGASVLTIGSGGSLNLAAGARMQGLSVLTANTSGNMVTLADNYTIIRECIFTIPSTSTGACIYVTGNANKMYNNFFYGVEGGTATGIDYASGSDNSDQDSVFFA